MFRKSLPIFSHLPSPLSLTMMKSNSIVESINDVGLSVKVMEDLMSRNLQHFVVPSESNNNSICIMIYENERWSTMVKQWGSVLGVHLYVNSILRDRRPLTDETGKHILRYFFVSIHEICLKYNKQTFSFSETLSDLKPINKFKWREDWTVMVDFSTDNLGYAMILAQNCYFTSLKVISRPFKVPLRY